MKNLITCLVLVLTISGYAQKDVFLTITQKLGTSPFAFNQADSNNLGNNFSVTRIDYYLSKFTIIHDGGKQTPVTTGTYILAKGYSNVVVNLGNYNVTNIEGIKFFVGVDAPTNNDDPSVWVSPHPLSPQSPSMHWGWSAGYRFVALEGFAGATLKTPYSMHGLGNANYFSQTVMSAGMSSNNKLYINLNADFTQALKDIDVTSGPIDHGVNATDRKVLQNFRDFVFSPGGSIPTTAITDLKKDVIINVYPNPGNGNFRMRIEDSDIQITEAIIYDLSGKIIQKIDFETRNEMSFEIENKGLYIITFNTSGAFAASRKLIVQ